MSLTDAQFANAAASEARHERMIELQRMSASELRRLLSGDPEQVAVWIRSAAEYGMPTAQLRLGRMLLEGVGAARNAKEAFEWFERAAAQKDADGLNMSGRCYENGWGVPVDLQQAVRRYEAAAASGLDWGEYNFGNMLFDGRGIEQDRSRALHWYLRAANQGHGRAMNLAGRCFEEGWGCVRSPIDAAHWYRRSAESGYFRGQYNYALVLLQLGKAAEAGEWLGKAAESGDPGIQRAIAQISVPA